MSQKIPDESEILQVAKEARSVFARLEALLRQKEQTGLSPSESALLKRNERELSSLFDGESRDSRDSFDQDGTTIVSMGEESTLSQHPLSSFDGADAVEDRDLAEVLQEARTQSRPTIHPAYPNTFKVRHAQSAREQANAERAITAAALGRPVRPKTPLNPALMVAQRPKAEKKMAWGKRGRPVGGGGGGGGSGARRPYDAEHAERMRRRAVSGAPKKRKVYSRGGGYSGGGMGMMDPEERYAEQRDDARSNRDGGSDRGGGAGNTRGWKGL